MKKIPLTNEEAFALFPKIIQFITWYNKKPEANSIDPCEAKYAEAIKIIKAFFNQKT